MRFYHNAEDLEGVPGEDARDPHASVPVDAGHAPMAECDRRIFSWSSGLSWGRREEEGVEGGLRCAHKGLPLLYRNRLLLLPQDKPT